MKRGGRRESVESSPKKSVSMSSSSLSSEEPLTTAPVSMSSSSSSSEGDLSNASSIKRDGQHGPPEDGTALLVLQESNSGDEPIAKTEAKNVPVDGAVLIVSPSKNKAAFLSSFSTSKICTDMAVYQDSPGARYEFEGIITAVHPASQKPDRRYVQVADEKGTSGLVFWNEKCNMVGFSSVGHVVQCSRVSLTTYNGKRSLTLGRDSSIKVSPSETGQSKIALWWKQLLAAEVLNTESVQRVQDQCIISVAGIVGTVTTAEKTVNGEAKLLVFVHITDVNGKFTLRSWNHRVEDFQAYLDLPVLFRRIRIVSYSGVKVGEIMESNATQFETKFDGAAALTEFWQQ